MHRPHLQAPDQFLAAAFASALGSAGPQPNDASPMSAFSMPGKQIPPGASMPSTASAQTPEQLIASALHGTARLQR